MQLPRIPEFARQKRSALGLFVCGMFVVWLLTLGLSLFHVAGHSMDSGCPITMSQGVPCLDAQNPFVMAERHVRFAQQLTQAIFQPSLLLLVLSAAVSLWSLAVLLAVSVRQHFRPIAVPDIPLRQRRQRWLALHERRDPYRW